MSSELKILYKDSDIVVFIKPAGVLSTDEPGGAPELLRAQLGGGKEDIRTVHRLDRVVSGLMVVARNAAAASVLSEQIRTDVFKKAYLACVHGKTPAGGRMQDLLIRNRQERKTYVTDTPSAESREAILNYTRLACTESASLVRIELITGRTHQIRCQFSSRNFPLFGDKKYYGEEDSCEIALWSHKLQFKHPVNGKKMTFSEFPPAMFPWNLFFTN